MPRPFRILTFGLCASAAAALAAPSAHAAPSLYAPTGAECRIALLVPGLVAGAALVDPLGYVYDTSDPAVGYGTLDDGSTKLDAVGRVAADAYDRFGALFVGDGQSDATLYRDPAADANGCDTELDGRQLALKSVDRGPLQVQRRIFVSGSAGSGARLLDSVTNLSAAPVETDVYVGDLRAAPGGTLGSDYTTRVHASSDGDDTAEPSDRWTVTTDGRSILSDPAIAHVWGGAGAEDDADVVRGGAPGVKSLAGTWDLEAEQFGWGWTDVAIAAGETRSYLSWETLRATLSGDADSQGDAAVAAAAAQVQAPLSRVYEGLTAPQIGSVANWAKPAVSGVIKAGSATQAGTDTTFTADAVDFGSSKVAACTTGTLEWDFGDGRRAVGRVVTHRFTSAGTTEVALTVRGTCGGTAVARQAVTVAAAPKPIDVERPAGPAPTPDEPQGPAPVDQQPAPARPVDAAATPAPPSSGGAVASREVEAGESSDASLALDVAPKLTATELGRRGVRPTLAASAPGTVRLVLSGGGLKIVKTKQVAAGAVTPAAMKLGPGDARRVKGLKTLQLRAKLTLESGAEVVVSRVITVGR